MKRHTHIRTILFLILALGVGLLAVAASGRDAEPVGKLRGSSDDRASGSTATLLSDGRTLVLGGEGREGVARLSGGAGGAIVELPHGMTHPRAWHSATVLSDGSVLIVGGIDRRGRSVPELERFDPATGEFRDYPALGIEPRARHSATLLTDGTVLIAGGVDGGGRLVDSLVVLDPRSGIARETGLRLRGARRDAGAELLPDGSVLISEGEDARGSRPAFDERFDPARLELSVESSGLREPPGATGLAFSAPADGESGVPADVVIGLRFADRLRVDRVNDKTVVLEGPQGVHPARVVAAEAGRLVFVTPTRPLLPDTAYRLSMQGMVIAGGAPIPTADVRFTTSSAPDQDGESWVPGARDFNGSWQSNRARSLWESMKPLQAPDGVTALAGQILTLDGKPLADVTLGIEGKSARTDSSGRFLLLSPPTGHQELLIDGRTASKAKRTYGIFEAGVDLTEGKTNVLPYTIWMPRIDTDHKVAIPSPTGAEVVVTTPLIPGLEVHITAGTVLVDKDGNAVHEVSITPIPIDRTPFPLPGVYVPIYFTIQPGGAYVQSSGWYGSPGIRLVYPNYRHEAPGTRLDFWYYEPSGRGWYIYGKGTVTADGRQVVPDPGVAIHEFTGAMISGGGSPPPTGPAPGAAWGGEPVDLSTGLFVSQQTDLVVDDVIPIVIRRTYRPGDSTTRAFGLGTNHPLGTFLYSNNNYQEADLILPDGGRLHYVRISQGTGYADAVYEHTTSPSQYYKSRIAWNGTGWDVSFKDGTVFVFDDMAPLQAIKDRYGNKLTITRSQGVQGNITRATTPHGRYVDFTYDASNRITQVKDNIGRTVGYAYDASGRLSTITDVSGVNSIITYDASNRILTMKDARGNTFVTNQYDANGRVYRQTLANGGVYQFAYTLDANGKVTQTDVTDPRNFVRRVTFTAPGTVMGGYPLTDTWAFGTPQARTITYEREVGSNLVLSVTDPLGRRTTMGHDGNGNVTSVTRLFGTGSAVTTGIGWDASTNQVTSITDPLDHSVSFGYDASHRIQSVTNAAQEQTTYGYGSGSQPTSVTFPGSHTFQLAYDYGDLVGITSPLGQSGNRFMDGAGRPVRVTDANGRWRSYEFSSFDRMTKSTDPLGGTSLFAYDANGNLLTATDPRAKVTTFTYNSMNQPLTRKDALNRTESFEFDLMGNLTKHTDRRGKVTMFTYDSLSRRIFGGFGTVTKGGNTTYESTVNYTYDNANRLLTVADSVAGTQTFTYDNLDRVTSESGPRGTVSYTYDAADRRQTMTVAGQPTVTYGYDNADRLTSVTQGTSTATVTYDTSGRRSTLTLPDGVQVTYGYDAASRLTSLTYRLGATVLGDLIYEYDGSGRRSRVSGSLARTSLPAAMSSAIYDSTNEMTKRITTNMSYDANGNLTNDGTNTYTYDARNQLATVGGGTTASFKYDGLGRRYERIAAGVTTRYLYDRFDPVQELSTTAPTANLLNGLKNDERFLRTDAAGARSFLTDILGSTVAVADAAGALQTQYTYEPFGKSTSTGPASTSAYQFTGRDNDGTSLFYYRARYYSPLLQRFTSEDPLRFSGPDINLYEYVGQDPVNRIDPFGLWTIGIGVTISGQGGYGPVGAGGSISVGIVFDGEGNVGWYHTEGASGVGVPGGSDWGGSLSGGLGGLWSPNARTICDLTGPFWNGSASGGPGPGGGGVGAFSGTAKDGHQVDGLDGYLGYGSGLSGAAGGTMTTIPNQVNIPWWLRQHAFGGN